MSVTMTKKYLKAYSFSWSILQKRQLF